eukprot:6479709-Amphidinium_carterae.1
MARKATGTILKRADDIRKFRSWCLVRGLAFTPVCEATLYDYVRDPAVKRSPTLAMCTISALRFASGLFGLDGAMASISPRVAGAAFENYKAKRAVLQAPVLPVDVVSRLETAFQTFRSDFDKVSAGFILFM